MNFSYSSFYKTLLKSSLDLEARSQIASLVAGIVCSNNPQKWQQISSLRDKYSSPLSQLSRLGYLPVSIPYSSALVNELVSLPSRGFAQPASGGRTETEYLKNVSTLPSVKKLIADSNCIRWSHFTLVLQHLFILQKLGGNIQWVKTILLLMPNYGIAIEMIFHSLNYLCIVPMSMKHQDHTFSGNTYSQLFVKTL